MTEVLFARENGWIPRVIRDGGALKLELGAGADANHDTRTFAFPVSEAHLEVIRADLTRHLLLWSAILPLCVAAGIRGPLDERAAVALLDPILFGAPADVESLFRDIRWDERRLVAQGADVELLEDGRVFAALGSATERSDWSLVREYDAGRDRARRGVRLGPLDEALLNYTDRHLQGGKAPAREPDAVDPDLLPEVMRVIATAEQACAGMRISRDRRGGEHAVKRRDWRRIEDEVERAVRRAYPDLVDDAVRTVSFLMCSEAADRVRSPAERTRTMARKRKTLPKDFEEMLTSASVEELEAVFDKCEIDARGGYAQGTAIGFPACPDELIVWLTGQGLAVDSADSHGRTPLHARASRATPKPVAQIPLLLSLGADIEAADRSGQTPLQVAVAGLRAEAARVLIEHGASTEVLDRRGVTLMMRGLIGTRNADIPECVEIMKLLLAHGASITAETRRQVERIGRGFEFHRENFNPDFLEETDAALGELYRIFGSSRSPGGRRTTGHHRSSYPTDPGRSGTKRSGSFSCRRAAPARPCSVRPSASPAGSPTRCSGTAGRTGTATIVRWPMRSRTS